MTTQHDNETASASQAKPAATLVSPSLVQFRQELAGMNYHQQVAAIAPQQPVMFNAAPPSTPQRAGTKVASEPAVQMLAGDTSVPANSAHSSSGSGSQTVREAATSEHPGERDASFNPADRVAFEVALAQLILESPDAYMATVGLVSTNIVAYIEQISQTSYARLRHDILKLVVGNKAYFGRLLDETLALDKPELAKALRTMLTTGGGAVSQHLMAHGNFMWNIYEKEWGSKVHKAYIQRFSTKAGAEARPPGGEGSVRGSVSIEGPRTTVSNVFEGANRARRKPTQEGSSVPVPDGGTRADAQRPANRGGAMGLTSGQDGSTPATIDTSNMRPAEAAATGASHSRGTDVWTVDEVQAFSQQARIELNMPLSGAGPSGTTADLVTVALAMGVSSGEQKLEYALACMGVLGAAGAHSFHEIMVVAQQIGVPYTPGSYAGIYPASFSAQVATLKERWPALFPDGTTLHPDAPRG